MIAEYGPFVQTLLGTLFTWGLTAAGAALVFVFKTGRRKVLDGSLGFAAGVMTAASFWSLLAPAIEMAERSGTYGSTGQWAFVPVAVGFVLGAAFVYGADVFMPHMGDQMEILLTDDSDSYSATNNKGNSQYDYAPDIVVNNDKSDGLTHRRTRSQTKDAVSLPNVPEVSPDVSHEKTIQWKRILLLIVAITIHNIPEGLAVGVGFGAIGKTASATFENARNLAIGIGIQNFPEGLAVSLPLRAAGYSLWRSFWYGQPSEMVEPIAGILGELAATGPGICGWYGQLSGMVEPIAGIFGALAVTIAEPILPYALAFAAGAMIYVVVDDILPESQACGNGRLSSWCCIIGFLTMMSLDVGLS